MHYESLAAGAGVSGGMRRAAGVGARSVAGGACRRTLAVAIVCPLALVLWLPGAAAQDSRATERMIPVGGAEVRGLPPVPNPPPPFGANLFEPSVSLARPGTTITPGGATAPGTPGIVP